MLQQGYAYASQNKGVLNCYGSTADDPLACRLNPDSTTYVHFYCNDPEKPFTQWTEFMVRTADLACEAAAEYYGHAPRRTYAVGISNGGYQVLHAIENAPDLFDGGVDWEGTYVNPANPNLLMEIAVVLRNFPAYAASGLNPSSEAAQKIIAAGYPPDIVFEGRSFWGVYWERFWEISMAQWQKRLGPEYDTYGAGLASYDGAARDVERLRATMAAIATTGKISRPVVSIAGTMDALLPVRLHARAYQRQVQAAHNDVQYRLYEIQNGNHVDVFRTLFPQLEFIEPHAHRAFDLLVDHVENGAPLPPDQCVPRGGRISEKPTQPGHARELCQP